MNHQIFDFDSSKSSCQFKPMRRLLLLVPFLYFSSCTDKQEAAKTDGSIVTTVGMIADVTRQIAGDKLEVINLIG